jgi:hypothetical protein
VSAASGCGWHTVGRGEREGRDQSRLAGPRARLPPQIGVRVRAELGELRQLGVPVDQAQGGDGRDLGLVRLPFQGPAHRRQDVEGVLGPGRQPEDVAELAGAAAIQDGDTVCLQPARAFRERDAR